MENLILPFWCLLKVLPSLTVLQPECFNVYFPLSSYVLLRTLLLNYLLLLKMANFKCSSFSSIHGEKVRIWGFRSSGDQ